LLMSRLLLPYVQFTFEVQYTLSTAECPPRSSLLAPLAPRSCWVFGWQQYTTNDVVPRPQDECASLNRALRVHDPHVRRTVSYHCRPTNRLNTNANRIDRRHVPGSVTVAEEPMAATPAAYPGVAAGADGAAAGIFSLIALIAVMACVAFLNLRARLYFANSFIEKALFASAADESPEIALIQG